MKKIIMLILTLITTLVVLLVITRYAHNLKTGHTSSIEQKTTLLKNAHLSSSEKGIVITGESVQLLDSLTSMNEAAIADGVCTQEEVDEQTCFGSPFYLRDNGYETSFPVVSAAIIEILYISDSGSEVQKASISEYLTKDLPFLLRLSIENDFVTSVQEVYIP